jgi:hypothetical protein
VEVNEAVQSFKILRLGNGEVRISTFAGSKHFRVGMFWAYGEQFRAAGRQCEAQFVESFPQEKNFESTKGFD